MKISNVLGIFLLAFFFKHVKANAVFISALITQVIIIGLFLLNAYEYINLPFLWLNFVGCFLAIIMALILSLKDSNTKSKGLLVLFTTILCVFGYLIYLNSI